MVREAAQCGTGAGEFEKCGECLLGSEASCCVCRRRWVGTELWGTQRYSSATDICPCTDKMEKAKQAAAEAKAKVEAAVKKPPREWETGICGCFEDFGGCKPVHSTLLGRYAARGSFAIWPTNRAPAFAGCMGLWCPCVVSYQLAPEADSNAILCCLGYVAEGVQRPDHSQLAQFARATHRAVPTDLLVAGQDAIICDRRADLLDLRVLPSPELPRGQEYSRWDPR